MICIEPAEDLSKSRPIIDYACQAGGYDNDRPVMSADGRIDADGTAFGNQQRCGGAKASTECNRETADKS